MAKSEFTNQASGVYTPTCTSVANGAVVTGNPSCWSRNGNVITVSTSVSVTPTAVAPTVTIIAVTFPIVCAKTPVVIGFANQRIATTQTFSAVFENGTASVAYMIFTANDATKTNLDWRGTFQYVLN